MENNKKTAIDKYLEIIVHKGTITHGVLSIHTDDLFIGKDTAKQMEREQIIQAYIVCDDSGTLEESEEYAEKYYNRTYGKET